MTGDAVGEIVGTTLASDVEAMELGTGLGTRADCVGAGLHAASATSTAATAARDLVIEPGTIRDADVIRSTPLVDGNVP